MQRATVHRTAAARTASLAAAAMSALLLATAACGNDTGGDGDAAEAAAPDQAAAGAPEEGGPVFEDHGINPEVDTAEDNQSTFALDVDTGSYTFTRGYLNDGFLPDPEMVRTEEFVNYFDQEYPAPTDGMGIHVDGTTAPFLAGSNRQVLRVGLQAAVVDDSDREPANLTLIVDVSGSMQGYNMEMARSGMHQLLDSLGPQDAVAIATFHDEAGLALEMTPMAEEQVIRDTVDGLNPGGSTNLEGGLRVGYDHAQANLREDGLNRVVLLSDGQANVGEEDPQVLADQIAQQAGDTSAAIIGIGRGTYNDTVLEQFADNGNGFYAYVDTIREAERLFAHDLTGTLRVVAHDAKVQVTFNPDAVSTFRLLGYENRQIEDEDFEDDTVDGGEVGGGHNVTALYEVTLPEGGTPGADTELATVDLRWNDPDSGEVVERSATITAGDLVDSFAEAPDRLRQSIVVAAFAETLRGAPWAEQLSLTQVADNADVLARDLPEDERVAELAELARTAADLAP